VCPSALREIKKIKKTHYKMAEVNEHHSESLNWYFWESRGNLSPSSAKGAPPYPYPP
jgi:hypothetical protein